MDYPSKVLAKAVEEISGLPGIGRKSALRLALHLLKQPESQAIILGDALQKLVTEIKYCAEIATIFQILKFAKFVRTQKETKRFYA